VQSYIQTAYAACFEAQAAHRACASIRKMSLAQLCTYVLVLHDRKAELGRQMHHRWRSASPCKYEGAYLKAHAKIRLDI
jgi:hypothetical protein